ncbi:MAG: helix-turn-helix domain-containing protein [Planctomycetes bacterium]|jgi:excisionase family DNA binding protein|nr:helix-turn-helix domain-containing protein [Planctomycetota bacterium]
MSGAWESKAEKARRDEVESELADAGVATVLDAAAVQQLLGLKCSRTVLRMIERGELVAFRIGPLWRIRRREVSRYIARKESMCR